jgi:gas vesicle protein
MLEELFGHKPRHNACDWLMGMAVGVAVGMAGALLMQNGGSGCNMKRTAHKMAKGAEHAVEQLDKMVTDFTEHRK